MDCHDEMRLNLPAYVASRLDDGTRRALEAHLADCEYCAEMVSSLETISEAVRSEGAAMIESHPDPMAIRAFALDASTAGSDALAEHLRLCVVCELEASLWRGREAKTAPVSRVRAALALAAMLVLGITLGLVGRSVLGPGDSPSSSSTTPTAGGGGILFLRPLRGEAATFRISREHAVVTVAVPLPSMNVSDDLALRFEIRRDDGEVVWSWRTTGARLRELEAAAFPVPTNVLRPGRYALRLVHDDDREGTAVLRIPFEIDGDS